MSVPILFSDLSGVVALANPAARSLLGRDEQDPVGRAVAELLDERTVAAVAKLAAGGLGSVVRRVELAGIPFEARASTAYDCDGDRAGVVTVLHDISQLMAADQIKDELLATVNHELRTPLTSLRGFAEVLLRGDVSPDDQPRFLRIMLDEAERLTELIEDFLDLQRLETGVVAPAAELCREPATLLRELVDEFARDTGSARVALTLDGALAPVRVDPDDLRKVLHHLLDNAHKYSQDGGDVQVSARVTDDAVEVTVRDEGIGIPAEHLGQIFRRFYRVDNSETRRVGGSGLGLTIVKHLVTRLGGTIRAQSAVGRGTEVLFTLPLAAAPGEVGGAP